MTEVASSIIISRCNPAQDKLALALVASGWPEDERSSRWQTITRLIRAGQAADVVLVAARREDQLVAAMLAEALPGRTAVTWLPQLAEPRAAEPVTLIGPLYAHIRRELVALGVHLVQVLANSDDAVAAAQLKQAGFLHAADLLFLSVEAERFPDQPPVLPCALEIVGENDEERLQRLIDRTYEKTLDCPTMDGLRDTHDVIAGYRAVGTFRPELWRIARQAASDVGCLLVNVHDEANHAEIIYLGVTPESRGHGLGLALTQHALWLARESNCERVVLAVDAENKPATKVYEQAGFQPWDKKAVWIDSLL